MDSLIFKNYTPHQYKYFDLYVQQLSIDSQLHSHPFHILFCGVPKNYVSQIAFARMGSTGRRSKRFFFPPLAFDTSNLSNGASAASAAQNSWDLALRTAECSNGTAVVGQQQPSQVTGSFSSLGKYNSFSRTVDSWVLGVSRHAGTWFPEKQW